MIGSMVKSKNLPIELTQPNPIGCAKMMNVYGLNSKKRLKMHGPIPPKNKTPTTS